MQGLFFRLLEGKGIFAPCRTIAVLLILFSLFFALQGAFVPLFGMFIGCFVALLFSFTLIYHKRQLTLSLAKLINVIRWGFFIRASMLFLFLGSTARFSREAFYYAVAFYFICMSIILFYVVLFAFEREKKQNFIK